MQTEDDPIIRIRRQWNDWQIASVHLSQIWELRWDRIGGGIRVPAIQPFIHGYVLCTDIDGEIAHSCSHGPPPHSIKVCVVKKDNRPEVFNLLLEIVGPKPGRRSRCRERDSDPAEGYVDYGGKRP